jgi:SNF2 family DNA or RNA helicase
VPDATAKAFPYKTQPWGEYQREILKRIWNMPAVYLGMEQGTGKTWEILNNIAALWLRGRKIDGVIVFAPKGVHTAWVEEQIPEHLSDEVPYVVHLWRSDKERATFNKHKDADYYLRRWASPVWQMIQEKDKLAILVMNSEAISLPTAKKAIMSMLLQRKCMLVVDEAGDFTTPNAVRTKALMRLRRYAPYRRVLEGVPVGTDPFEIYAPMRFLNPNILGYESYGQFKEAHAEWETLVRGDNGREFKVIKVDRKTGKKMYKDLDKIAEKIKPYMVRVTKAEVLQFLPPKQYHKMYFNLTQEQWRLIHELRNNLMATLPDGRTATVQNVLSQYLRMQQVACGYIPPDRDFASEEVEPIAIIDGPNPRLEACVDELVRYGSHQTIIWTRFHFDIDLLRVRLAEEGYRCVVYDGRTSGIERDRAKMAFQQGDAQIFLGNSAAGGRGLNLQAAQHEIFYANYFGYRRRAQAEDRGHRIGSSTVTPVTICDLVGEHCIDVAIVRALRQNKEVADDITGDPSVDWI